MKQSIALKLKNALNPAHLEVINESHQHNVPPGSESHYKVVIVASEFEGQPLVKRHQAINQLLKVELAESIHALSLQTLTPTEWAERNGSVDASPPCLGGSQADKS